MKTRAHSVPAGSGIARSAVMGVALIVWISFCSYPVIAQYNPNPPASPVRLVFIHHSVGENWLSPWGGGLLDSLNRNQYYVHDTNYDWGPIDEDVADGASVGSHTDIGHWYNWFLGPHRSTYVQAVYTNNDLTPGLENSTGISDPGGENTIVLFKSCFVSVQTITGQGSDLPTPVGQYNALCGHGTSEDSLDERYSVANIKGLYRDLLAYFATRQDKLFVLITSPPLRESEADDAMPKLRAINTWLVNGWLRNYPLSNVAVFDFSNVLTSNGGDSETNDLGSPTGGHHRFRNGTIEHQAGPTPFLAYAYYDSSSTTWDNHPTAAGSQKAASEFVPLLNIAYNRWKAANPARDMASAPEEILLAQNYPNPFSQGTTIDVRVSSASARPLSMKVYDLFGREVLSLSHDDMRHSSFVIRRSDLPASGWYYYRVSSGDNTQTKMMVLLP